MPINESWPYVEEPFHSEESDEHMRLKNLAVHWLLSRGFTVEDIEHEHYVDGNRGSGRTDIYANNGSVEVYIECDAAQKKHPTSMSRGGKVPAERREAVFVFREDGIYRVDHEIRTTSCNVAGSPDIDREFLTYTYISDLPMLDLRAYK